MRGASPRVAILGAGIMGSSLALYLARKGVDLTLFDKASEPFSAASRWNEGKIHLGYLYSADASLRTAHHVVSGGLMFRPLVEDLIGCGIGPVISEQDDIYLCHRDSVVQPDAMAAYMQQVTELLRTHPDAKHYLADVRDACMHRLSDRELAAICDPVSIVAGFRVPERSVETTWLADRFVEALAAETRIELQMNTRVRGVEAEDGGSEAGWRIDTDAGAFPGYDYVINALWEGRLEIDLTVGLQPSGVWSNRYRQSLFLRTTKAMSSPCVVIATGPFGDIKNYNGRDFYLSWYPDGLRANSSSIVPPEREQLEMPDPDSLVSAVFGHLQDHLPWVADLRENAEAVCVEGGWVFAAGQGLLSAAASSLHRRSDYGVVRKGTYLSIDTGKYSTAPWLARSVADSII